MLIEELAAYPALNMLFRIAFSVTKYFLVAGLAFSLFYVWKYRDWLHHKIQDKMPSKKHLQHEIFWSVVSRAMFGVLAAVILYLSNYTRIYFDIDAYSTVYFVCSIPLVLFLHDTYFYWAHRIMHHPKLYKTVHKVHHHSTNPTPLASFSFHPSEAMVEAAFFPIIILIMPMHPFALLIGLAFQILFNVYGHSGFELAPRSWVTNPILKYINTSTHHNLHHKEFHYNFGLYFNHWDRWMGTLDPLYEEKFYKTKDKKPLEEAIAVT